MTLEEIKELQEVLDDLQEQLNIERRKTILKMLLEKLKEKRYENN